MYHRVLLGPYKEAAEAENAKEAVSRDLGGRPILIHHYPGNKGEDKSEG